MKRIGKYKLLPHFKPCDEKGILVTEEEYGKREIVKCVENWSGGKLGNLIASFAEAKKLTEKEKEHIRRMLDGMD